MKYEKMYIRSLNAADLDSILELQENTLLGLKDPSVLRKNSPEILLQALSERNIALGVFIDDKLIAIGIAVDPVPPETDLRVNLQKFSVDKAMDLKLCIVREGYRGNGLQAAFICVLEKLAYIRGTTHFCTSVSPNNSYSIRNVLLTGYEYDHQESLYGGLLRNVYVKELKVNDYNNQVDMFVQKFEGTVCSPFEPDFDEYIHGESSICSTGDIAEYLCENTGKLHYGLIIKYDNTLVLLQKPDGLWELSDFASKVYDYELKRVLINVKLSLPSGGNICQT